LGKIRINKSEAARRQLDAAIRMLFSNEDIVAIFTLAVAGLNILKNLAEKRTDLVFHEKLIKIIRPGTEKEFWQNIQRPANYLKHADRDPDAILDGGEDEDIDWTLFLACMYYKDLGYQLTPEMSALTSWHVAIHKDILLEDDKITFEVEDIGKLLTGKSRPEQLKQGKEFVRLFRSHHNRY
jgi:hypothetical protein